MKLRKITALVLSLVMLIGLIPTTAFALSGETEYTPAESNISGKYWVTFASQVGDAKLAADDDLNTAWTWASAPATLTVDLGGTYDEIHKIETVFADNTTIYQYKIEGSTDGANWSTLADRTGNTAPGANFADLFTFAGLRYVKLTVTAGAVPGVKEFKIINYLRKDMNNGSDSSTVSYSNSYYYDTDDHDANGIRGGQLTEDTMATGDNYFGLVKDLGWDVTRLRVWNEPRSEGDWRFAADVNEAIDLENPPTVSTSATSCSPEAQKEYAKYIIGAGQELAIDFHYSDSWSDPQNQPKPYAWAELSFDELVEAVYDFTYDYIKQLIEQDTAPTIVAIGNEITNGMMWGSEYLDVNPYADYHDYYKRFIRDNSEDNLNDDGTTKNGRLINPDATPGGGVKWIKYEEANGDTSSAEYQEFVDSVQNLAALVDAGNRAIAALNDEYGLDIQTEMHFAFNVIEQPRNSDTKVELDPDEVLEKVKTLIGLLADNLDNMGGMVDRIGVSYYPDWHGTYDLLQKNIVELSKMLPGVKFNVAECSPAHSGSVNDRLDNPNYPVGTTFNPQLAGDIAIEIMKAINDVPNNAGQGVWPWNGQSVYGVRVGDRQSTTYTLQGSFRAWNDAFAKNVVESSVSAVTTAGKAPVLPTTVKSLDMATGRITDVNVSWEPIYATSYAKAGSTFVVHGKAAVIVPESGKGKAMDSVTATVTVTDVLPTLPETEYSPAESNISGKYWVTFTADEGNAALAADNDLSTAWTWTTDSASLTVDLGGAYNEVHKLETVFADSGSIYQYKIEGSTDGASWKVLADRTGNTSAGANFTDLFTLEGLRYVKLTVTAGAVPGVKEFRVINYLRKDMNNGSDSSTVSYSNSYYYDPAEPGADGIRGGQLTEATKNTGNNYFGLVKDLGWDVTRLRVWNEPRSEGNWRYAADVNEAIDLENPPTVNTSATSCSPEAQKEYAKYIIGAGQELAIDFHYSDSWSDPQNQPKPYAWAELPFDQLVEKVYEFTYNYIEQLIQQDTVPSVVAIGNEITNGMMWGSEYLEVNEYADYHDYYKRFIRDNSESNLESTPDKNGNYRTIDGRKINPNATPGGGVKWLKYAEANGDTSSAAYQEFVESVSNLATLVDAGNRAIAALNEKYDLDIKTEMHFAFNVIEEDRATGEKIPADADYVFGKVTTLVGLLADDLDSMGGMVDRIGVSYYPDWHGTYDQVQRNIVELSKMLPDVDFNIAECRPDHSGTINSEYDNPNYPVGTQYTPQLAGDIAIEIMKTINDVPNNVGQGVWPWNGQSIYGVKWQGSTYTLQPSFTAWNDAFAKNVVESTISVATVTGKAPVLPATIKSLDMATGEITDVNVSWEPIYASAYAATGTFEVHGKAAVTVPADGKGQAMDSVTAVVTVLTEMPEPPASPETPSTPSTPSTPVTPVTPVDPTPGDDKPAPEVPVFADVAEDAYYAAPVAWAVEKGVTTGTSVTTFSPDLACTRKEIATFLWRAAGSPEPETTVNPFTDVAADTYYYKAVLWAYENGITTGTSATTFSPDMACTRWQVVTFLWRTAGKPSAAASTQFSDVPATAAYAQAVAWAVSEGITTGTSATAFSPNNICTRGQIVTFLYRTHS